MGKKIFFLLPLIFLACQSPNLTEEKPFQCSEEYFNSYINSHQDKTLGLGIAPININGKDAQRKSAITKALNDLALQKKVKVYKITETSVVGSKAGVDRKMGSYSIHTLNGIDVHAKIIKSCKDASGRLYILMQEY